MAQCKLTPAEFIKNAFTPQIAVMCSSLAEQICQKNNLSFIELVQPFSKLNTDVHYKDATNTVITVRSLKLSFYDINSKPPNTASARKSLNYSVSSAPEPRNHTVTINNHEIFMPTCTPWFEAWRDTFLAVQYPSDHEYTKHFLACILVVSSLDNKPSEAMSEMLQNFDQNLNNSQGKLPKWFSSNVLKFFVVIHDNVSGNHNAAIETYDIFKQVYGAQNSFLLKLNSRPPDIIMSEHLPDPWSQFINNQFQNDNDSRPTPESSPNSNRENTLEVGQEADETSPEISYHPLSPDSPKAPFSEQEQMEFEKKNNASTQEHGACLSTEDVEQVKLLIYEFTRSCLIPYLEKQVQQLNDCVSNKKGVSRSLFSATKRWFNPNKPGASAVSTSNLIYSPDAPELQIRKLGDLYFMFGHYHGAYEKYHIAKRDYNTDQAWLYYAGALEMAALSAFMGSMSDKKTCDYMEESITTYLNTCKMPQFATRATVLSSECLKSLGMYGEAAHQLIRMTSEDSDLRSALLLEQAAYCFLQSRMVRKYAFHMVLSGHRFSKAAQRKHSLRSYKQAHQIYKESGWDLAGDHIHYTIGRQANNLQSYAEAVESFSKLLEGKSKQTAEQQSVYMKEYLTILETKHKSSGEESCPILPIPQFQMDTIKVLVGPPPPLTTPGKIPAAGIHFNHVINPTLEYKFHKLEEMLVQQVQGSVPLTFRPVTTLYTKKQLLNDKPMSIVQEPIQISFNLVNTLQVSLNLSDIHIVWDFITNNRTVNSEDVHADKYIKTHVLKTLIIPVNASENIILVLTPLQTGDIVVKGISYVLSSSSAPNDSMFIKGRQVFHNPDRIENNHQKINNKILKQLNINIVPSSPCLQVSFSEVHGDFLANEMQKVNVFFQNTGSVPLCNIHMATSVPHLVSNCEFSKQECVHEETTNDIDNPSVREKIGRKNHITSVPLPNDNNLIPGQSATIAIWIRAPEEKGNVTIDLLIYYENIMSNSTPRYRLVRHYWTLAVHDSIEIEPLVKSSHNSQTDEELSLAVTVTNLNKVHYPYSSEITILNVGLLSNRWKFTKDIVTPTYINLHSQESAHLSLKAKRRTEKDNPYSNIPLNSDNNFLKNLSLACLAFAKKTEHRRINLFDDPDNYNNFGKLNINGVLILQWQALVKDVTSKRMVSGQTHVPLEIIRYKKDPLANLQDSFMLTEFSNACNEHQKKWKEQQQMCELQTQISYNLIYPALIEHNFNKQKICIVPITIVLHNTIEKDSLCVQISTIDTTSREEPKYSVVCPSASKQFRWVGKGVIVENMGPLSTKTVKLSVAVLGPGCFDLGAHTEILCNKLDEPENVIHQISKIHSTLIVVDSNN